MNFFKKLFGVSPENKEQLHEERQAEEKKNFDILKYDGVKALKMQQFDYAIECFRHALELNEDLEIYDYMSQAYIALGRLPEAYKQLQKLADAQPDNISIFIRMAHVAYMMEDYVIMGTACEKALLIDKDSPDALYLYAKSCLGTDDVTNAIAMLTRAILVKSDYADAYLLRGEVQLKEGHLDEADEDAMYLLEKYPDNEDILMLKAKIEKERGNVSAAIGCLDRVIDSNPFRMEAYKLRGELRMQTGDEASGQADLEYADELAEQQKDGQHEDIEQKTKEQYTNASII